MSFNIWEEAAENDVLWKKENMKALLRKKKGVLNLDDMSVGEEMLYNMTKSQLKEALEEYAEEERNEMLLQKRAEAELEKFGVRKKREEVAKNPPVMKKDTLLAARAAEVIAKSDVAHAGAVMAQRVSDSYINPAGIMLRAYNYTKSGDFSTGIDRVKARNKLERGLEAAAGAVYEGIPAVKTAAHVYDVGNMIRESVQLGRAYDRLSENPFLGKADDIVGAIKPLGQKRQIVQRGHAALNADGDVVTHGRILKRETGSERNFGINKFMRLHNMSKRDVMALPRLLRKNKPTEVSERGGKGYHVKGRHGEDLVIATSPMSIDGKIEDSLASYYRFGEKKIPSTKLNLKSGK